MFKKIFILLTILFFLGIIGCGIENESSISQSSYSLSSPFGFENWSEECREQWYQLEKQEQKALENYNKKLDKAAAARTIKDKEVTIKITTAEKRHRVLMYTNPRSEQQHIEMVNIEDKMRMLRKKYEENDAEYEDMCNKAKNEYENDILRINKKINELILQCGENEEHLDGEADIDTDLENDENMDPDSESDEDMDKDLKEDSDDETKSDEEELDGEENPIDEKVGLCCTKAELDSELQTITTAYNNYVAALRGFRGCIDITIDLRLMFGRILPKIKCWNEKVAWRMTVYMNAFWCTNNFMHNAFMVRPCTASLGHTPQIFDPYTLFATDSHPARIQNIFQFVNGATCGGTSPGLTITKGEEARRAQECVTQNALNPNCKDIYDCLKGEWPNIVNYCR